MATRKKAVTKAKPEAAVVVAYKGFEPNWQCRGFQFEVGKTYEHAGSVVACESGFHACEYPLHVLRYYKPSQSVYAVVEQSGELSRHSDDTKIASQRLTVTAQIDLAGIIKAAIKYTMDRCTPAAGGVSDKPNTVVVAKAANKSATASGYSGAATASGNSGAATASGDSGAATASGNSGAATASGNSGAATASGYSGAATASGYSGAATASGDKSSACAPGRNGKAKGIDGAALFLVYRDSEWNIKHVWAGIVGRDGIKPDTFYALGNDGRPVEVK